MHYFIALEPLKCATFARCCQGASDVSFNRLYRPARRNNSRAQPEALKSTATTPTIGSIIAKCLPPAGVEPQLSQSVFIPLHIGEGPGWEPWISAVGEGVGNDPALNAAISFQVLIAYHLLWYSN